MTLPTNAFTKGSNVKTGCLNEFKFIESNLRRTVSQSSLMAQLKGTRRSSPQLVIFQSLMQNSSLSFLKYLHKDTSLGEKLVLELKEDYIYPVHIFTDRISTQEILCQNAVSKVNFYLVEEIQSVLSTPSFIGFHHISII
jgi:hypothetical protein